MTDAIQLTNASYNGVKFKRMYPDVNGQSPNRKARRKHDALNKTKWGETIKLNGVDYRREEGSKEE